mmetsp:Transcript_23060/g.54724  ORF Transcript_23060/g.54724 Transcript_23060/m.54724 type:complete len:104 (-) Transcript_23060:309-620(-)
MDRMDRMDVFETKTISRSQFCDQMMRCTRSMNISYLSFQRRQPAPFLHKPPRSKEICSIIFFSIDHLVKQNLLIAAFEHQHNRIPLLHHLQSINFPSSSSPSS